MYHQLCASTAIQSFCSRHTLRCKSNTYWYVFSSLKTGVLSSAKVKIDVSHEITSFEWPFHIAKLSIIPSVSYVSVALINFSLSSSGKVSHDKNLLSSATSNYKKRLLNKTKGFIESYMSIIDKNSISSCAFCYVVAGIIRLGNIFKTFIVNYISVPSSATHIWRAQNKLSYKQNIQPT